MEIPDSTIIENAINFEKKPSEIERSQSQGWWKDWATSYDGEFTSTGIILSKGTFEK